jgi:hypothetical protein
MPIHDVKKKEKKLKAVAQEIIAFKFLRERFYKKGSTEDNNFQKPTAITDLVKTNKETSSDELTGNGVCAYIRNFVKKYKEDFNATYQRILGNNSEITETEFKNILDSHKPRIKCEVVDKAKRQNHNVSKIAEPVIGLIVTEITKRMQTSNCLNKNITQHIVAYYLFKCNQRGTIRRLLSKDFGGECASRTCLNDGWIRTFIIRYFNLEEFPTRKCLLTKCTQKTDRMVPIDAENNSLTIENSVFEFNTRQDKGKQRQNISKQLQSLLPNEDDVNNDKNMDVSNAGSSVDFESDEESHSVSPSMENVECDDTTRQNDAGVSTIEPFSRDDFDDCLNAFLSYEEEEKKKEEVLNELVSRCFLLCSELDFDFFESRMHMTTLKSASWTSAMRTLEHWLELRMT